MNHLIRNRFRHLVVLVSAAASVALLAACGGGSSGTATASGTSAGGSGPKIATAKNATLKSTVLVDANGMTLYALSVEKQGHFICTDSKCLAVWHPVTGKPSGSVGSLGTVARPDGTVQAAYKGRPLYTFASDTAAGQAGGEGFKDVGVWHAVTTSGSSSSSGGSSGGGGYSGGGY